MGAWSTAPFGNDDASDFLSALEESSAPASGLREALESALEAEDYLEAPEGSVAVAAAAVVAERLGGSVDGVGDDNRQRIASLELSPAQAIDLEPSAAAVLDRVEADNSELLKLWQEAGEDDDFRRSIQSVRSGLSAN